MKNKLYRNTISMSKFLIESYLEKGQTALDCTLGNGKDSLLLARQVGQGGKVFGFDIQDQAIANSKNLLNKHNLLSRVQIIKDSHENIDIHIKDQVDFIVYNLGYLPGGDKSIVTKADSTILSLRKAIDLLKVNGLLMLTSYRGHEAGKLEYLAIDEYFSSLDQKLFNVIKYDFINQVNQPPVLYMLEKIG